MPDTSEDIVKTESKVKPRNKKGFREPTSLHVDPKLWQEVRIMSVLKNVSVTEYFERALRKQIDEDNREAGRQGYQVGHGGMYIPPPPVAPASLQTQQEPVFKPKSEDSLIKTKGKSYPDYDKIPYVDEHLQLVLSEEDAKKMTKQQKQILRFLGTLGNVRINLPGIKFPTNKNTIIEHAEKANTQA